jgi:flagellar L-ring protein FlgH
MLGAHRKRIRDYSWIYVEPPVPPEIKLHDIVTIIVDEKSEVIMNSKFNRQRRSVLKAELKEFVRLGSTGNLTPAALNAPTIDAQLQGTLNSTGQLTDQEGIKYRIAATVVDVLPNGVLQLEARKTIQTQDDVSEYTLTGELRATDVSPDNTASSENIASLNIVKQQRGRVYDSTKRNWGYRLYDLLSPF